MPSRASSGVSVTETYFLGENFNSRGEAAKIHFTDPAHFSRSDRLRTSTL